MDNRPGHKVAGVLQLPDESYISYKATANTRTAVQGASAAETRMQHAGCTELEMVLCD
jgi:hypothetical protein